jgi:hypothetical protein
MDFVSKNLK